MVKKTNFEGIDFQELSKKDLKKLSNEIKPVMNLGKNGITDTLTKTVDEYLEAHNIMKLKCLIADSKEAMKFYAEEIAKATNSEIIDIKGFTFTLFRI